MVHGQGSQVVDSSSDATEDPLYRRPMYDKLVAKNPHFGERLEPIVENSACVEAGTTISQTPAKRCQFEQFQLYYLRRGEISGIEI
ncbi:hypothetical protein TNCV_1134101 [Trichonephila clavipes]|nr:hypothetical protein TNCV_1134101 [Trichonephila clavipes]